MNAESTAAGSLSLLLDIVPVVVIIIIIIAFAVNRRRYRKEKAELNAEIAELESEEAGKNADSGGCV